MNEKSKSTAGVDLITGDPKKAILKLSSHLVVAMLLTSTYNLIDAIWVSGLGGSALAAIGFVTPLYMVLVGLSNGLGAGATSAISRCIGAGDTKRVNNSAIHAIILTLIISLFITFLLEFFLKDLLLMLGAKTTLNLSLIYGRIVFVGTIFMLFTGSAYGILRGEGDTKRTMYAMMVSAIINMILDPILIYSLGMGIAGAAWATLASQFIVSAVIIYWFFHKKDTFTSLSWKYFKADFQVAKSILEVALPASVEFLVISMGTAILNIIFVAVAGTDAVAIYSAGWRVVMIGFVPLISIGAGTITVAGVAYGARKYKNLSIAHSYSIKIGMLVAIATSILTFILAPYISMIFTYSPQTSHLSPLITEFLRTMCLFYIFIPPGLMSNSIFQGMGKGTTSLILTIIRQLLFIVIFAYILAIIFNLGQKGAWWGIVAGDIVGSTIAYLWARIYINRLQRIGSA
ncbi:MATE family efflux transporter [Methanothermobacter tenebrarum]|nr:MATE family efflux transporter [Methanothermobacter tenebrarum]